MKCIHRSCTGKNCHLHYSTERTWCCGIFMPSVLFIQLWHKHPILSKSLIFICQRKKHWNFEELIYIEQRGSSYWEFSGRKLNEDRHTRSVCIWLECSELFNTHEAVNFWIKNRHCENAKSNRTLCSVHVQLHRSPYVGMGKKNKSETTTLIWAFT